MSARSSIIPSASAVWSAKTRVAAHDWQALAGELDSYRLRRLAEAPPARGMSHHRSVLS